MSNHRPIRPVWMCRGCSDEWPCVTRRQELLAEYDGARVSLILYMTSQFTAACIDMPGCYAGELYDRFVGWISGPRGAPG